MSNQTSFLYKRLSGLVSAALLNEGLREPSRLLLIALSEVDDNNPFLPALRQFEPRIKPLLHMTLTDTQEEISIIQTCLMFEVIALVRAMDILLGYSSFSLPAGYDVFFKSRKIPYHPNPKSMIYTYRIGSGRYENDPRKNFSFENFKCIVENSVIFEKGLHRGNVLALSQIISGIYQLLKILPKFGNVPVERIPLMSKDMVLDFQYYANKMDPKIKSTILPTKLKKYLISPEFYQVMDLGLQLKHLDGGFLRTSFGLFLSLLDVFAASLDLNNGSSTVNTFIRPTFESFTLCGHNNFYLHFVSENGLPEKYNYTKKSIITRFKKTFPEFYQELCRYLNLVYKNSQFDERLVRRTYIDQALFQAWHEMSKYENHLEENSWLGA